jgi:predicted CXXCH cytochrome family protein
MMSPLKLIKTVTIGGFVAVGLLWTASNSLSKPAEPDSTKTPPTASAQLNAEDFVGSETCKACHEEQFTNFSKTKHARVANQSNWKGKMQGCESCHGPGKAHVEGGGDKTKIHTFVKETSKQISETCLTCHAGREEHNNYRRGEHWRNDVGCTDCHSPHAGEHATEGAGSSTFISAGSKLKPDVSTIKMLNESQPQLCLKCHNEMKGQFTQPFHHKVLEGAIKCSDCHNPHGGFEAKQTRLATGADVPCLKCHTDKQGPFVFEHAPLKVEGCTICHAPHGAANAKLLKRNDVRQLCLECHSNTHEIGAPNTPSFHNQATARFQNCTTCHVKIHGSQNHQFFFR